MAKKKLKFIKPEMKFNPGMKKYEVNLNSKTDKKIKLFFCPKCRSKNVFHPFGLGNLWGLIPKWRCRDCGFEAGVFPIIVIDGNKLKKKVKEKK